MATKSLDKKLKLLDVVCLASGAMISSGLFILPGIAFAAAGPAVIVAYGVACLLIVPAMLVQAELATAMPKAGGSYVFIERSLGPLAGTFAGFLNWISIALKASFALVGLGAIAHQFFPQMGELGIKVVAVAGCLLFTAINLFSVKSSGRMQVVLVLGLVSILLLFILRGVPAVDATLFTPFMYGDFSTLLAVSGLVFVSFGGLTKVASLGEEVVKPSRNLPLGMFLAWLMVSILYLAVITVTVGTVDPTVLSGSLVPVGLSARETMGTVGLLLVDVAAALAFITTANAGIMSASRTPLAMSRDGLVPELLSRTHAKYKTPQISIFLTSASMIAVISFLSIENLVKTASTIMILLFIFLNIAVIILRLSKLQSYQPPFRMPLVPLLPALASVVYVVLIFEMGWLPLAITAAFGVLAGCWYLYYVRPQIDRQSAFVHLVKSVIAKPLQRLKLEDELRQISLERATPELAEFYQSLEHCLVLDIEGEVEAKDMYRRAAESLHARVGLDVDDLHKRFLQREFESSTVLHPEVSIPMVVVNRPGVNDVLLVRAKDGIWFSRLHQPVKAAIVLIGSIEKRNVHLRALMRLTHIVEHPKFLARWLEAHDEHQLRDVLLVKSG